MKKLMAFISKTPATLIMATITILTGIVCGILWGPDYTHNVLQNFGYGLPAFESGIFLTILTGVFFATPPLVYLVAIPVFLVGAFYVEYTQGTVKMLVSFFAAQILSVVLVSLVLIIGINHNLSWAVGLENARDVGLSNGALALIGVATAMLPVYWRFRVRLVTFMALLAMVLFSAEISDLTHLVGFSLGLIVGPLVIGRPYEKFKAFSPTLVNSRAFVAALLLFYAITHFVTHIIPGNGGVLEFGNPIDDTSFIASSVIVFVIALFSYGLYKGRKTAWAVSLFFSVILLIVDTVNVMQLASSVTIFKLLFMSLTVISLAIFRRSFTAKTDPLVLKKTAWNLAIGAVLVFITNVGIIYGLRRSFTPEPTFRQAVSESIHRTFNRTAGEFRAHNEIAGTAIVAIDDIWFIYIITAAILLVVITRKEQMYGNKEQYERLLKKWGGSTLSWMGTWDGLSYFSNKSKTATLAFKQEGNVAVVLSDPIGSRKTSQALMLEFNEYCVEHGWTVSYFSSSAWVMRFLSKHGFKYAQVAEDTIVQLENLEFSGKSWQSVRTSINKAKKVGVKMQKINYKDATFSIKDQLHAIEDSWVGDKSLPEMGFTLGNLSQTKDDQVRIHIAIDETGNVHGMTSWLPVYEKGGTIKGWTLDIMQRRLSDQAMPGVIEFLIADSAKTFKEEGCKFISLSGAPLSITGEPENIIERAMLWASVKFEPYYGFTSLHRFKEKFHPSHEPMYLCYKEADQLPMIGIAIGRAYMNDASLLKTAISTVRSGK